MKKDNEKRLKDIDARIRDAQEMREELSKRLSKATYSKRNIILRPVFVLVKSLLRVRKQLIKRMSSERQGMRQ